MTAKQRERTNTILAQKQVSDNAREDHRRKVALANAPRKLKLGKTKTQTDLDAKESMLEGKKRHSIPVRKPALPENSFAGSSDNGKCDTKDGHEPAPNSSFGRQRTMELKTKILPAKNVAAPGAELPVSPAYVF